MNTILKLLLIGSLLSLFVLNENQTSANSNANSIDNQVVNLAVVACGDRTEETLVLLKSTLLFTHKSNIHFYIFTEEHLKTKFIQRFEKWPDKYRSRFTYTISNVDFPKHRAEEWRQLFRLCASQRIFLPDLLKDVDSLLYVDTDVLFLSPLDEIWSHFSQFNATHLAALAPEHEEAYMGWYNRFARHPYYGKLGLNSGVMLMNLTRMREFEFTNKLIPIYEKYKQNITWGDQCLLNILFHYHSDRLYVYDCKWNYRPDHCMYGSNCKPAEQEGVRIMHGCRRVFHNDKEPSFAKIYEAIKNFNWHKKPLKVLMKSITKKLNTDDVMKTYCGKSKENFFKHLKVVIKQSHETVNNELKKDEL